MHLSEKCSINCAKNEIPNLLPTESCQSCVSELRSLGCGILSFKHAIYIYIHCCFVPRLRIFEIDFASHPDSIPFQCRVTSVPR